MTGSLVLLRKADAPSALRVDAVDQVEDVGVEAGLGLAFDRDRDPLDRPGSDLSIRSMTAVVTTGSRVTVQDTCAYSPGARTETSNPSTATG